jgi:hypothetical protein
MLKEVIQNTRKLEEYGILGLKAALLFRVVWVGQG